MASSLSKHDIIFYTHTLCPYAHRVALVLAETGLAHKVVEVDLSNKPSWFLSLGSGGLVPAISYNGRIMTESIDLCRFLERIAAEDNEEIAANLEPGRKSFADKLIDRCDSQLVSQGLRFAAGKGCYSWGLPKGGRRNEENAGDRVAFQMVLDEIEESLGVYEGTFFLGGRVSSADCIYYPFMERFAVALQHFRDFDMGGHIPETGEGGKDNSSSGSSSSRKRGRNRLRRWMAEMGQRSSTHGLSPPPDDLLAAYMKYGGFDYFDYVTATVRNACP